jgi:mannose-6-phosphate isomerase
MKNAKLQSPLFFERNRVFRVYEGGKLFHDFFGDEAVDGNLPEEWIASKVKALNKEMRHPDEGLSKIRGGDETFASLLANHPEGNDGWQEDSTSWLRFSIVPSGCRRKLTLIQPSPENILQAITERPSAGLFLRRDLVRSFSSALRKVVTEADLRQAVEKSELPGDAFSGLLQEVEAKAGDVWLIPARVAHAIGAGCLILEVQEPTDFTIQPERWCDRYRLSDQEMYLGLDKEVALSCFDLQQAGPSVLARGKKLPQVDGANNGCKKEILISFKDTPCFAVNRYTVNTLCALRNLAVYVVTKGDGELVSPAGRSVLKKGMYFFVPFAAKEVTVSTKSGLEIVECLPPAAK